MNIQISVILLCFIPTVTFACANHVNTSIPHIYDKDAYFEAVDMQSSNKVKSISLDDILSGEIAPSQKTVQKNKFLAYYQKNVLSKDPTAD